MNTSWLITPDDGMPEYVLSIPMGEEPDVPDGYAVAPAPPPRTLEEIERADAAAFEGDGSWASPQGLVTRAERDRRVDAARWATDAATSPLTAASRAEWAAYVRQLHRLTVDFATPANVTWPEEPRMAFVPA
jgi:hypothetical protein